MSLEFAVNCKSEMKHFDSIVSGNSDARVMAIRAATESGKSHFVRRIHRRCLDADEPIPAVLVDFADFHESDFMALMREFGRLGKLGVDLGQFVLLAQNHAIGVWDTVKAVNDLRGADLTQANITIIGTQQNADTIINQGGTIKLETQQQLEAAATACVDTFFAELRNFCAERPAVIILDTVDQCDDHLRGWIEEEFQRRMASREWPERLVVVVAAQDTVPAFGDSWMRVHRESKVVQLALGSWLPEDIVDGFREVGLEQPPPRTQEIIGWLQMGASPAALIEMMKLAAQAELKT